MLQSLLSGISILFVAATFSHHATAQETDPILKLSFPKFKTPPGWTRYDKNELSNSVQSAHTSQRIAFPYRGYIFRKNSFTYSVDLPSGSYRIVFGLLEKSPCRDGARVIRFSVGNQKTRTIDVHKEVGCLKQLDVPLDVVVADGQPFDIKAERVSGTHGPLLNNIQVYRSGSQNDPVDEPTTPTTPADLKNSAKVMFSRAGGPLAQGYTRYDNSLLQPSSAALRTKGNDGRLLYRDHVVSRPTLTYNQPMKNGKYSVRLGFMEYSNNACVKGKRVFSASVEDKKETSVDVFGRIGCNKPYNLWFRQIEIKDEMLTIKVQREKGFAPFLSNFEIHPTNFDAPEPAPGNEDTDIKINVGPQGIVAGTRKALAYKGAILNPPSDIAQNIFRSARYGKEFTYNFNLAPGAYDITLGFIETFAKNCDVAGKRVFSVYVNEAIQLEGFDIYAEVGCQRVKVVKIPAVTVGAIDTKPLSIRFLAVSNFAQVAYIRIKSSKDVCIPASTTGKISADHAAHAVPGSYPPQNNKNSPLSYVDFDGDGFHTVNINGKDSHSHFFDTNKGIIGKVTEYTWSIVETGEVISKKVSFSYKFPLGTTRLKLSVLDNSCTTDDAETTVTVTGKIQPGQYCYYYPGQTTPLIGGGLEIDGLPESAYITTSLDHKFSEISFQNEVFSARCIFFLDTVSDPKTVDISTDTGGSGDVKVYKGEDLLLDTLTFSSAETLMATGLTAFEVIYTRTDLTKKASLKFKIDNKIPANSLIKYDQSTVKPIITSITPTSGPINGGTQIKVLGHGLFAPLTVSFGKSSIKPLPAGAFQKQFLVKSPKVSKAGVAEIYVESSGGVKSNSIGFTYGESKCDPVAFQTTKITVGNNKEVDFLNLPTSATLGPDGRIYMGTLGATVQVLGYDPITLKAKTYCNSKQIFENEWKNQNDKPSKRDILGIAFNPKGSNNLLYVSTSTLYWHKHQRVVRTNKAAWRNGAIHRMKITKDPGSFVIGKKSGICVEQDERIITGLPVSNLDHSVNSLLFTQKGDLLIAVGGNTNMGLPGWKLGGMWETQLSGSILIAQLSKGSSFNGHIKYSNEDVPYAAKKKSGDVEIYASGMRNIYPMTMTQDEEIYATDQGPNCSFGNWATACDDFDASKAKDWSLLDQIDWPSQFKLNTGTCDSGPGRRDKIIHVKKGKFYGHPNIQRGVKGECAWIDPLTDLSANGGKPPSNYVSPIRITQSSATTIGEYGASHFCSELRGDILISTYRGRKTWRMRLADGKLLSGPEVISATGGIQFVEDMHGNLIFPRLSEKMVTVFKPKVTTPVTMTVVGVWPRRHNRNGGSTIFIGGYNFKNGAKVTIGNKACSSVKVTDREIQCKVPKRTGNGNLSDLKVTDSSGESTLTNAVLYTQ